MQVPFLSQQQQQNAQPQQQPTPASYAVPPAPTFASLGSNSVPMTGTLGSLAQGQPVQPPGQGLSAAIPPSAYLMQQSQLLQQQQLAGEKRPKREDANFGLILPLHKVKRLIKSESNVKAVSGEASYAIARATELIMEHVLEKAHKRMVEQNRASIEYDDIAAVIAKWPATDFLRDIVPETQTLMELIERVKRQDAAKKPAAVAQPKPPAAAADEPAEPAAGPATKA